MRAAEPTEFAVKPPGRVTWLSLFAIVVLLPIGGLALVLAFEQIDLWWPLPLALALFVPLAGLFALGIRRRRIELRGDVLRIEAAFYTQRLALSELDLDSSRVVELDERPELGPSTKTNGFAMPGYYAGHFRSRLRQRLFCLVTSKRHVLALHETSGRIVLLSAERPQALLDTLRARQSRR